MKQFGIIGHPVKHSLSPTMFNAAFQSKNLPYNYSIIEVKPENLEQTIKEFETSDKIDGFNVTIPHKEKIVDLLNDIDTSAKNIKSVNTVIKIEGAGLKGYNTDIYGFDKMLELSGITPLADDEVTILGTGGAAKSVLYVLAHEKKCKVHVLGRSYQKAERIAESILEIDNTIKIIPNQLDSSKLHQSLMNCKMLVNCTPIGMEGMPDFIPLPLMPAAGLEINEDMSIVDIAYRKSGFTPLIDMARQIGLPYADGKLMLLHQSLKAYEIFTGEKAPEDIFKKALFG